MIEQSGWMMPYFSLPQTIAECETTYATTGRGPSCYCTPMSGCFHKNFQLKPRILADSGLFPDKSSGMHDHDYFFSIRVTNKALLVTELVKKVKISRRSNSWTAHCMLFETKITQNA